MIPRQEYSGPTILSFGFRPFFLGAILFALAVVPVWLLVWHGTLEAPGPFLPADWHVHEMIFGYAAAVVAGFLFTAVPNWTGRMPARGIPLAALFALWILGRLAVWGALGLPPLAVLAIDCAFLFAVIAMIAREIIAGRNWRNLKVLVPLTLLCLANAMFHAETMISGSSAIGRRLGLAVLIFLIMLIGGRIIPSFTRNWLAKTGAQRMPAPFSRFDTASLFAAVPGLALWVLLPETPAAGVLLVLAGGIHLARLSRWRGGAVCPSPLLLMLHVAYLFVPLGLISAGLAPFGLLSPAAGAHLLGIGAVGGMTLAVMARATLGHTGRDLVAGPVLTAAFVLLMAAAAARVAGFQDIAPGIDGVLLAGLLWTAAFALLAWRVIPWLAAPRLARKAASRAAPRT
ncbi:NnrS family protein [Actibacterium sp. MT2.3-13A]|uniref:NnrS family protein n=1 Tax=Actibacterium sp. MT2.3-13A TaxID=2828332 RepID=UPI001BAD6336|nr:NnrS family protein [Actibacterium sp. MT2.3-13A]